MTKFNAEFEARMRTKRLGQPQSKEAMEQFIKNHAPALKQKALAMHERIEKSPTALKIVEKGAKSVIKNLAAQEGKVVEKEDIKITKKDYDKAKKYYQ